MSGIWVSLAQTPPPNTDGCTLCPAHAQTLPSNPSPKKLLGTLCVPRAGLSVS